jgi:hypothetical protein
MSENSILGRLIRKNKMKSKKSSEKFVGGDFNYLCDN